MGKQSKRVGRKSLGMKKRSMKKRSMKKRSMKKRSMKKNKSYKKTLFSIKKRTTRRKGKGKNKSKTYGRRRKQQQQQGGYNPFIGDAYKAVDATPYGNYLEQSNMGIPSGLPVPPVPSNGMFGGGKGKGKGKGNKKYRQGGGSFLSTMVPENILNVGRAIPSAIGSAVDSFNGVISSPSSMVYPTQQPLVQDIQRGVVFNPPDILKMHNTAGLAVSDL